MEKSIHDELIRVINENKPEKTNPVDFLMDILPIKKESAYKKLRGGSQFTLEEAVKISQALRIYIFDYKSIMNSDWGSTHIYHLDSLSTGNMEDYINMVNDMSLFFSSIENRESLSPVLYSASGFIPHGFSMGYRAVSKFNLFKWMYRVGAATNDKRYSKMSDVIIPQQVVDAENRFAELADTLNSVYVFSDNLFESIVKEIKYFHRLGIVTDDEQAVLKEELSELLLKLERYAQTGESQRGRPIAIYISQIFIDATYILTELANGYNVFCMSIYGLNFLGTEGRIPGKAQKTWIESLVHHSTLISQSGLVERIKFFSKQKEFVDSL